MAAIDYGNDIDLHDSEIQNALVQNLAADPGTAPAGKIIYNTASKTLKVGNGTGFDGVVASVGANAPLTSSGGKTPTISIPAATNSTAGHATAAHIQAIEANTSARHSHSNKTVLDNTTASFTTADETKLDGLTSNATHTGDVTGATALTIAAKAVTLAKMADLTANSIIGNNTGSVGVPLALTAAQVRAQINVADGANNYSHPIGDGNSHVPTVGTTSTGKFLKATGSAAMGWAALSSADIGDLSQAIETEDAVVANTAARHSHDNKAILDATTASFLAAEKTKLAAVDTSKQHTQNSDTGTSSATFTVGTGATGPKIKNDGGALAIRNNADTDYGDLKVKNIYIEGDTVTTLTPTTVELGDSIVELNRGVGVHAENSNGGFAVLRYDETESRADAFNIFDEAAGRFKASIISSTGAINLCPIAHKLVFSIGDGTAKDFVLTHNLNTRAVVVSVSTSASPYADIITRVEKTSLDTVTVKFKNPPAASAYIVTIVG